jgi:hypothetical protein
MRTETFTTAEPQIAIQSGDQNVVVISAQQ